jgi:very-short-patch-repair endonuclease
VSGSDCRVDPNNWGQANNDPVDELIARIANRQGGVVSRVQLIARGVPAKAIDYRIKIGRLRVIHRGVYAVGHDAIPIRGKLCAALLVAGPGSALSHTTAAHVLTLVPSMPQFVEITTTRHRRVDRPGLKFHHAATLPTTRRHGLPTTTALKTLLDLAATHHPHLERAASEALVLKLVTEDQLRQQQGPGAARLRALVVGRSRSRFEAALLKAVVDAGLPRPLQNHRIGPYEADFFWPALDLVIETDGAPYHDHALARRRDEQKTAYLRALGYTVHRARTVADGLTALATRTAS